MPRQLLDSRFVPPARRRTASDVLCSLVCCDPHLWCLQAQKWETPHPVELSKVAALAARWGRHYECQSVSEADAHAPTDWCDWNRTKLRMTEVRLLLPDGRQLRDLPGDTQLLEIHEGTQ